MASAAWRRLLQRIVGSNSSYPEYKEYRDKDDYDPRWEEEERSTETVGAGSDDLTAKLARLKLAAGFVLVLSLCASIYLYYVKPAAPEIPVNLRDAAATEALRRTAMGAEGASREQSIDDIKRWANDVTRRAEREVTDTYGAHSGMPAYYGQGTGAPGITAPWTPPTAAPPVPYDTSYPGYSGDLNPLEAASADEGRYGGSAYSSPAPSPSASTRRVPSQYDPPLNVTQPSQSSYSDSRDTYDRPYHPRRYEPVVIEPRVVEPY
jgi:hypothetical protein